MIGENKSKNGSGKGVSQGDAMHYHRRAHDSRLHNSQTKKMTRRVQTAHSNTSKHDIFLVKEAPRDLLA